MNPFDSEELYNKILLGGVLSPGVVRLSGHDRNQDWDIKAAKGQDGASSSLNGKPIGQFQATFTLVVDYEDGADEIEEWRQFQNLIESTTNGQTPVALPIYHPDLALNGFTEVTNGGIGGMIHDGKGGALVTVKFVEYRPPKPKPVAGAKAKASAGTTSTTKGGFKQPAKPDPNADAKAELAALLAEAQAP